MLYGTKSIFSIEENADFKVTVWPELNVEPLSLSQIPFYDTTLVS